MVFVVCEECYNFGEIDWSVVVVPSPPFYFVFETPTSYRTYKIISRNELARPVMGTNFLVICSSQSLWRYAPKTP